MCSAKSPTANDLSRKLYEVLMESEMRHMTEITNYTVSRQKPKLPDLQCLLWQTIIKTTRFNNGIPPHRLRALLFWRYASPRRRRSQCRAYVTVEASSSLPLPAVLTAPIRLDVVRQVHSEFNLFHCSRERTHGLQRALPRIGGRPTP